MVLGSLKGWMLGCIGALFRLLVRVRKELFMRHCLSRNLLSALEAPASRDWSRNE